MTVAAFRPLDSMSSPQTFEFVSRDRIFNKLLTDILAVNPEFDTGAGQPLSIILDTISSYYANSRLYQNNLRLGTLTRFATGADLAQKGYEVGLTQQDGETEASFRNRIISTRFISTATNSGLEAAVFRQFASEVLGIDFTYSHSSGVTTFYPLAKGTGQRSTTPTERGLPSDDLKSRLDTFLSSGDISNSGDSFTPADPTVTVYYLELGVVSPPGVRFESLQTAARQVLTDWVDATYNLGNEITQQAVFNAIRLLPGAWNIKKLNTDNGNSVADLKSSNTRTAYLGVVGTTITVTDDS